LSRTRKVAHSVQFPTYSNIAPLEAFVPLVILHTWPHRFQVGTCWTHFIDNQSALHCLISEHSRSIPKNIITDAEWEEAAKLRIAPWFYYAPSEHNLLDGRSRGEDCLTSAPYGRAVEGSGQAVPPGGRRTEMSSNANKKRMPARVLAPRLLARERAELEKERPCCACSEPFAFS
jgi:hypothetical protein